MASKTMTEKEKEKDRWQTPPEIFQNLNREFRFEIDAAANSSNSLCPRYFSLENSAMHNEWDAPTWCNPPYSTGSVPKFITRASEQFAKHQQPIVMLVPASTGEGWFLGALKACTEIRFIVSGGPKQGHSSNASGRLSFLHYETQEPMSGNKGGSMLLIWHPCHIGNLITRYVSKSDLMKK